MTRNYKVVWPDVNESYTPTTLPMSENKALKDKWMLKWLPGSRFIIPSDAILERL